jgi:hypothetical protein
MAVFFTSAKPRAENTSFKRRCHRSALTPLFFVAHDPIKYMFDAA